MQINDDQGAFKTVAGTIGLKNDQDIDAPG
jgi:hypothetical protein